MSAFVEVTLDFVLFSVAASYLVRLLVDSLTSEAACELEGPVFAMKRSLLNQHPTRRMA
ncbi:MAG: hypothetical protein KDD64_02730 [Bdellovibrionales bacterium]|nr:hypothetical protein [Bdellovibrionales bacterium]